MTSIVLTGFMGTGKTAVGRELARRLGLSFIDTDVEVERVTGRTVQQLFDERGEADFRAIERAVLRTTLSHDGKVVATGGGTLIADESRSLLAHYHRVICLTADFAAIEARLKGGAGRPLARNAMELRDLLEKRHPVYSLFEQVDTTDRTIDEVAAAIALQVQTETTLQLDVEDHRRSDIVIGTNVSARLPALLRDQGLTGQVILVTDSNVVGTGIANRIEEQLADVGRRVTIAKIPAGESHKTLETLGRLYDIALAQKAERSDVVVGLGGGVVGDIAGMLAATYLRGTHLVLVPTTLLAQADAAIGGKVGVDLHGVKNMIGAFYPAELIVVDPALLGTLPPAEMRNGMAEIVKIAAMRSEALFAELEGLAGMLTRRHASGADRDGATVPTGDGVATEGSAMSSPPRPGWERGSGGEGTGPDFPLVSTDIVRQAAQLKVDVVREDPRERGVRAQLNYGHTIGHGIEAASDYRISHGEAVSIGMVAESELAEREGWAEAGTADRIRALLARFGLPASCAELDRTRIHEAVDHDKKRAEGQIRIAMPEEIGRGTVRVISAAQLDRGIEIALGVDP